MTDEKFTELVNLYFDKEISAEGLRRLKAEIAACPERKRAFAERCRLDKAMRLAFAPRGQGSRRTSTRRRFKSRSASAVTRRPHFEASARSFSGRGASLPRWVLGSGLVASLVVAAILLTPVFRDTVAPGAQPALVGLDREELQDPLASLSNSELRRYAAAQEQAKGQSHASLVAQMRLMGLRPELTPQNKELREVGLPAHYEPKHQVSQAELFQRIQAQRAIPEPSLLRYQEVEQQFMPNWPEGFQSAPVRFEEL